MRHTLLGLIWAGSVFASSLVLARAVASPAGFINRRAMDLFRRLYGIMAQKNILRLARSLGCFALNTAMHSLFRFGTDIILRRENISAIQSKTISGPAKTGYPFNERWLRSRKSLTKTSSLL